MTPSLAPENAAYGRLANAKLGRNLLLGETCRTKTLYGANVIISELRATMPHAFRHIDMPATRCCIRNNMRLDAKHFGDLTDISSFGSQLDGLFDLSIADRSLPTQFVPEYLNGMPEVLPLGDPFEVFESVVGFDAILVIADAAERGANETGQNQKVDQASRPHVVDADSDTRISGAGQGRTENAPAVNSRGPIRGSRKRSDASEIRDLVMVRKFGDRAPFFDIAHDASCGDEYPTMSTEGLRFPQ